MGQRVGGWETKKETFNRLYLIDRRHVEVRNPNRLERRHERPLRHWHGGREGRGVWRRDVVWVRRWPREARGGVVLVEGRLRVGLELGRRRREGLWRGGRRGGRDDAAGVGGVGILAGTRG